LAARPEIRGILHLTDAGEATRYEFAVAIQDGALRRGLIAASPGITPIASAEFPTIAQRPAYSVLDTTQSAAALSLVLPRWRDTLGLMLDELHMRKN
jgi:dTDP-4-dehydrorhamnose reductase